MAGLFTSDPAANDELAGLPDFFVPVPIVDPRWPQDVLDRYRDYPAVRITPGSHGYRATEAIALRGPRLILQMRVADPRNLPADLPLPEAPVADAIALAKAVPTVIAGAKAVELHAILTATDALADLSLAEEPDVLRRAVAAHGADRLLIGTHTPFLTPAAAAQKLRAAHLSEADRAAVTRGNAERIGLLV